MDIANFFGINPYIAISAIIWTFVWKGMALWKAARLGQSTWFIALLIINTLGILEIFYLFWVTRGYQVEVIEKNG